jgi:hypothetical protein
MMYQYQGRAGRRAAQVARSQLAVRLGLAIYAGISVLVFLRCLVLLFGFPASVWTMKTILTLSAPFVLPFSIIPAAQRMIIGAATLSDLTTALILLVLPLPFLGRRALPSRDLG